VSNLKTGAPHLFTYLPNFYVPPTKIDATLLNYLFFTSNAY